MTFVQPLWTNRHPILARMREQTWRPRLPTSPPEVVRKSECARLDLTFHTLRREARLHVSFANSNPPPPSRKRGGGGGTTTLNPKPETPNPSQQGHAEREPTIRCRVNTEQLTGLKMMEGYHESRICARDTCPESYITKYTSIRRQSESQCQNLDLTALLCSKSFHCGTTLMAGGVDKGGT